MCESDQPFFFSNILGLYCDDCSIFNHLSKLFALTVYIKIAKSGVNDFVINIS